MKSYLVEPENTSHYPKVTISADSHEDAYGKYLKTHGYPDCALGITQKDDSRYVYCDINYYRSWKSKQEALRQREMEEQIERVEEKIQFRRIAEDYSSGGINSLSLMDMQVVASAVDDFFDGKQIDQEFSMLLKEILTDPEASNYFQIRNAYSNKRVLLPSSKKGVSLAAKKYVEILKAHTAFPILRNIHITIILIAIFICAIAGLIHLDSDYSDEQVLGVTLLIIVPVLVVELMLVGMLFDIADTIVRIAKNTEPKDPPKK